MPRKTSCKIVINLSNETAREESVLTNTNSLSFADIQKIKNDDNIVSDFLTFELNQGILDGTLQFLPEDLEDADYTVVSSVISDEDCIISDVNKPCITINFPTVTTTNGFTFSFKDAMPEKIRIRWYDGSNNVISDMNFTADNQEVFICLNKVKNFRKVEICFVNSNFPFMHLKMENMDFGIRIIQNKESISSASILEELNMISSELSINKLNFTLFNADDKFNLLNPLGYYQYLETGAKVIAYEYMNDALQNMGTFFLDKFESQNSNEISFDCIDSIGKIAKTNFKKGKIYTGETVESVINEIMLSADFNDFTVMDELKPIQVYGYIPVCSHREALQQLCFSIRAVADCSRSKNINIYRINSTPESRISGNRIFLDGSTIKMKENISDISITTHRYTKETELRNVFEGNLDAGIQEIEFSNPTTDLVVNGAAIIDSGLNFVKLHVPNYQNVVISGKIYNDSKIVYNKSYDGLKNNTLKIADATLVTEENINLVLNNVFNYYGLRKEAEQEFILETEKVGKWYNIASQLGYIVSGGVESQRIDLVNGFLSEMKIVGYNAYNSEFFFTGTEIYTGQTIGEI